MNIVNLTPHEVVIYNENGVREIFEPSGIVARVGVEQEKIKQENGIDIMKQKFTEILGLPDEKKNTLYIVSYIVLQAGIEQGRKDLVAPNTSKALRDENGFIVSVPSFITL